MSRYAATFVNPAGPGDARPTALQIVKDEGLEGRLGGRVFLVTGCSSGIGIETVRAIHATGATVFGTVRSIAKGQAVVDEILTSAPDNTAPIHLIKMELDSLDSVREGAQAILERSKGNINVIINNAGIMAPPYGLSKDGWESQFATCHLGHFLLFQLLKDALLAAATPEFPSRVVSVSSGGHRLGEIQFDDLNFTKGYQPFVAYGQAKTANIYFANEIERRFGPRNLHATSLHPGIIETGLDVHVKAMISEGPKDETRERFLMTPQQGAATSVYAAVSKEWATKGGKYLANCVEQPAVKSLDNILAYDEVGYAPWAYDAEKEGRLWKESLKIVGLPDDI